MKRVLTKGELEKTIADSEERQVALLREIKARYESILAGVERLKESGDIEKSGSEKRSISPDEVYAPLRETTSSSPGTSTSDSFDTRIRKMLVRWGVEPEPADRYVRQPEELISWSNDPKFKINGFRSKRKPVDE
jgi:hypothetical protein